MIPRETSASIELPVAPADAWRALAGAGNLTAEGVLHLEHADVALDSVTPGEAAGGDAHWDGLDFRVAVHLVPRGADQTLLLLTAEGTEEPHGLRSTAHASAAHRRARQDLEALAVAVGRQITG